MSDDFDDDGGWPPGGYSGYSGHFDDAAERDKLLGALADAMSNKDSSATRELIKQLVNRHGDDTNIDLPLEAVLKHFHDWGERTDVFEASREVTDWSRRDGGPKDFAMQTILELAKSVGEQNPKRAADALGSVLYEAPEDSAFRRGAIDAMFALSDNVRERDPETSRQLLTDIARNAGDGSSEKNRAIDGLIALAEQCRASNEDVASEAIRDALWQMDDGDPRQAKAEDMQAQMDGQSGKDRAEGYRDNAKPMPPDEFRQRFGL